jgi:hypothetical protein
MAGAGILEKFKGKIGEVYCRAAKDPNATYAEVRDAILAHFHLTPEEYRRRFRNLRPAPKEMPWQFSQVMGRHLDQWLEASKLDDFDSLRELILSEQIMKCYAPEEKSQANTFRRRESRRESRQRRKRQKEKLETRRKQEENEVFSTAMDQ